MNIKFERKVDEFGRITLPGEQRSSLGMQAGNILEMSLSEDEKCLLLKVFTKRNGVVYSSRIDELGRITIPKEIRGVMQLEKGTALQCSVDEKHIILRKLDKECCIFTRSIEDLVLYRGFFVSRYAIEEMARDFGYRIRKVELEEIFNNQ